MFNRHEQGFTPLHWAAYMGDLEAVRLLVENGADAKAITKFFHTALSAPFLNQDNSLEEGRIFILLDSIALKN